MTTRLFVVAEFFVNNRGRLEFVDAFALKGVRAARAILKDPEIELNTRFSVYEVIDGALVAFGE